MISSGGYDSSNEPGITGTAKSGYCHNEPLQNYPAASNYAEKLTGITGVTGNTLYFVNPWVTYVPSNYGGVLGTALTLTASGTQTPTTQMYVYVNIMNTRQTPYTPTAGWIDLGWYSANHLEGVLLGVYYGGTFYPAALFGGTTTAPSIKSGTSYYAIYKMTIMKVDNNPSSSNGAMPSGGGYSTMFWGDASITNGSGSSPGNAEDQSYLAATVLVSGLWVRYEGSSSSC